MVSHVGGRGPGHISRQSASSGSILLPERLVATRCRVLSTLTTGTNREVMSRTAHVANDNISSLKIAITNTRITALTPSESDPGTTVTVTASVEYPSGTFRQITFGGVASVVIADGAVAFSDYTTGDLGIPNAATFWIRTYRVTAGVGILYNNWKNSALGETTNVGAAGAVPDATMTASITGGSTGNWSAPPTLIIARTNTKSICLFGDSKVAGNADTAESATASGPGLVGEIAKSLPAAQPFVNLASGGLKASDWNTAGYLETRKLLLPYFTHLFMDLGHNDFMVSGASYAAAKASLETVTAGMLAANPSFRITLGTIGHKSTSAGGQWINDADQTPANNAARNSLNTDIRNGAVSGQNNGYFEIARQIESTPDSGIWKNDGVTPQLYTAAGIHETPAGYSLIVSAGAIDYATKLAS